MDYLKFINAKQAYYVYNIRHFYTFKCICWFRYHNFVKIHPRLLELKPADKETLLVMYCNRKCIYLTTLSVTEIIQGRMTGDSKYLI